jgi:hypothetical protein
MRSISKVGQTHQRGVMGHADLNFGLKLKTQNCRRTPVE